MTDSPHNVSRDSRATGLLRLARRLLALKSVPRTGWLDRGVEPGAVESVAAHSLGVTLIAWACALEQRARGVVIDPHRVLLLALVHDLPEAETGDVTPYDPASIPGLDDAAARREFLDRRHVRDEGRATAKRVQEDAAMRSLLAELPSETRSAVAEIWEELQQGSSPEAKLVKQADRLETFLQSLRYAQDDPDLPMASFRQEVLETLDDPLLQAIRDAALEEQSRR